MTQSSESEHVGAPGSAYIALVLGIVSVATFSFPPLPIVIGAVGLFAALRARSALRSTGSVRGTVPSLIGAILSVIGILTVMPRVIGLVLFILAPR
ncbi:MAG: hypothetical protein ACOH19_01345 [Rhodoglobus sp.]